ncbi:MAG: type II secretion system protein GspL [Candidatus Competibacteraceae bacterium]
MPQLLLFRFLSPEQVEWFKPDAGLQQGTAAELVTQVGADRLLLVAPGEAITLTTAQVPGRQRSARLKALPFALEDNLATDVEELHFAVGEFAGDSIPVAVVDHKTLQSWLDNCTQAGLNPYAVIPEPLLLPYGENSWSLLQDDNRVIVRSGRWDGFVTDQSELETVLNLALAEAGEQAPQSLRVWGELAPELTGLAIELHQEESQPQPLRVFADGYQPDSAINLLQGPYSRQTQLDKWLRPWRAAAAMAGIWLLSQLVLQIAEYRQLKQEQVRLSAAMEQVYKEAVPEARKVINPRVQLESRLRELRSGDTTAGTGFLELLYRGGQPLQGLPGVTLRSLRYKENQLDFDLEGGSLELFDQLKQRFTEQTGVDTQIRTTKKEDKVESQITVKKVAS